MEFHELMVWSDDLVRWFGTEYDVNYTLTIYATTNNVHSFSYQRHLLEYILNHYIRSFKINLHGFPSLVVSPYMHMIKLRQNSIF